MVLILVMKLIQDEEFIEDICAILSCYYLSKKISKRKVRSKPRYRISAYLQDRKTKGRFATAFQDMVHSPLVFKENFRMLPDQFNGLHELLKDHLSIHTSWRPKDFISSEEKLAVTLEYLASGTLFRHLASCYRISKQHLGTIIDDVCAAIIKVITPKIMPKYSTETWVKTANRFNERWNMPNCIGSIDGKHCAIKCPAESGSVFYNYKGFYSLVLMAVADADYRFLYFDVGAYGSEGDSGVFRNCSFGRALNTGQLNIPPSRSVHGQLTPMFFVADDAFPLTKHIMKPYKPTKSVDLDNSETVFNYRLSRSRRTVENAFGILCSRWTCLQRTMLVKPTKAQKIITACCLLHNYLSLLCKEEYAPPGFSDTLLEDGSIIDGYWIYWYEYVCWSKCGLCKTNSRSSERVLYFRAGKSRVAK